MFFVIILETKLNEMKNYSFALLLLCGLLFFGCNRDDDDTTNIPPEETPPQKTALEFANLAIGNYWIYEKYLSLIHI